MIRFRYLIIAVWYALSATPAPVVSFDLIAPRTKLVAQADFPCAHHDCACRTAEQCRLRCCCFPETQRTPRQAASHLEDQQTQPIEVRISALSEAHCRGDGQETGYTLTSRLLPHLPLAEPDHIDSEPAVNLAFCFAASRVYVSLDPPDKVPIA